MVRKKKFVAADSAHITDRDAQVIGNELLAMDDEGIDVTPQNVLARAEPQDSNLHKFFDWDVDRVAGKFWVIQARRLIGSIKEIEIASRPPVRSFHSVTVTRSDHTTIKKYKHRREILRDATGKLEVATRLYKTIRAAVLEAGSLHLGEDDVAWARIIATMTNEVPVMLGDTDKKEAM